jgi:hypothetical protein
MIAAVVSWTVDDAPAAVTRLTGRFRESHSPVK